MVRKKKNTAIPAEGQNDIPAAGQTGQCEARHDPKNLKAMKDALSGRFPAEAARILVADSAYLCNRFLQNNLNREIAAKELGLRPSKCSICQKAGQQGFSGEECPYYRMPLNSCRNGIIDYLEQEDDQEK